MPTDRTYGCFFCGLPSTPEVARSEGWEPYFWDGDLGDYQDELPTCRTCCGRHLRLDTSGEAERVR